MQFFERNPELVCSTARLLRAAACVLIGGLFSQCTSTPPKGAVVVSVKDQKLGIYSTDGKLAKKYDISTSKFGLGDQKGSNCTPLGKCQIVAKIGHGLPAGAVLKSRRWNGEVLKPNAPGRDPIVSRILWLKGVESTNRNAFNRFIYIHGTPEEKNLGRPASYGCVRMGMKDVVDLFNTVNVGSNVVITKNHLPRGAKLATEADDDSPALQAPEAQAQPIEIAKIAPSEGEKKRAAENAAKAEAKLGPATILYKAPTAGSRPEDKVVGKTSVKTKSRA
ncbi:MAG: L,D-transpeptidase [Verrucomicrobia bacterium]|nr:L,D-transpeptidase [Verrucomicrobiota bacterium]